MPESIEQSRAHVAKVARTALEKAGASVPESFVAAIAEGRGNRSSIEAETRRLFGTDKPLDLVLFDTDRIASYVFESSRPPILAGASKILSELNADIARDYHASAIFSAGGEGLLLLPMGKGEEVRQKIERRYHDKTSDALGVTTELLPVGPHDFIHLGQDEPEGRDGAVLVTGNRAVLARLRDAARGKKDRRLPPRRRVPGDKERCVACRDREAGATAVKEFREEEGRLCDPCALRWRKGRNVIKGASFPELTATFQKGLSRSESPSAKSSYISFLYADGNSMGALFGRLGSLADVRFLSLAVSHVFREAELRARADVAAAVGVTSDYETPVISFLGGGDEAIWILPAALALRIIEKLPQWIDEATVAVPGLSPFLRRYGSDRITFGAGLVICGESYPVRYQYYLAKSLQKNAKSMFYGGEVVSSVDFEVLTDSSPSSEDLDAARSVTYRTDEPGFIRTCRPYTVDGFRELLRRIVRAEKKSVAKSQLYSLQDGAVEGRSVFLNYLRYQIARKPAGERYQAWLEACRVDLWSSGALEEFFIQKPRGKRAAGTWIADAVDLAPFLELLEQREL